MATYLLHEYLQACNGQVQGLLVDAGMKRPFNGSYGFHINESNPNEVVVYSESRPDQNVIMPVEINLTPELLCFLGLYSGDGNKTGGIGFAQRNVELLESACVGLNMLFSEEVELSMNLLNDSRYFMRPEFRDLVESCGINQDDLPTINAGDIPNDMRECFRDEYIDEVAEYPLLRRISNYSVTISPLKGAREPGQESREYIVNISNSRWLLPLVLRIIEDINDSLSLNEQQISENGQVILDWGTRPSIISFFRVNLSNFLRISDTCRWYSSSGEERRYPFTESDDHLIIGSKAFSFRTSKYVDIGPITSYASGLYLAEGTTNKHIILHFNEEGLAGAKVALSFNSSENSSLAVFLRSLHECLGIAGEALTSWKIKVGSQYMYEMQVLGEKMQSPMVRKGPKGQGKSKSVVHAGLLRDWAMKEFEELSLAGDKFSHIEYTGAGVPRVQVNCSSTPARFIFALYRMAAGTLVN